MRKRLDLCIDARMSSHSGIGTCIRELAPLFQSSSCRVILLVDKEAAWSAPFEQIFFSAPIYSIREQLSFPLKIPSCDLFWSPHYNIPVLPIRAKKRLVTIHDCCHLAMHHLLSFPEKMYAKWMMRRAMHQSDLVVTDSLFSKTELIRLVTDKSQLRIVHMGVNHERFFPIQNASLKEAIRNKYQLPEKFLLFVGSLKPHKNISGLLKAFQSVKQRNLSLVLIGKYKGLRHLIEQKDLEKALIVGEIPDEELSVFYSMAELFIFPSLYEGFGLPPLEAMCCGCPVLVSNVASIPEICKDAALYFDPNRPEEIAEVINRALQDETLRESLRQKGLERASQYTWTHTAQGYISLFEQVRL